MIYLDNSATTYPKPESVYKALDYANRNFAFNAGRGNYKKSSETSELIDDTRNKIGSFVGVNGSKVVFTSSATESLNMIINGLGLDDGDIVYITPFEHNAIVRPLYNVKKNKNITILTLPFDKKTWKPDMAKISEMFSIKRPTVIFCSQVSNVLGLEIDYKNIFECAKQYNATTVLDSAQSFGVSNPVLNNVDFCVFAGHKSLYASFGIAGFIFKDKILSITKSGGNGSDSLNHDMPISGHERYESGSMNSVAIAGLNESCKWLKNTDLLNHEKKLIAYLIDKLKRNDKVILYLPEDEVTLGILSINVKGYSSDDVANILSDEFDIMVRSGYHCSPFVHDFINSFEFKGTVRISVGAFNTIEDMDALAKAIETL